MDQITHEMRLKNWEHVVEECNRRPEGVTVKQWLSENGINVKVYQPNNYRKTIARDKCFTDETESLTVWCGTSLPLLAEIVYRQSGICIIQRG